MYTDPTGYKFNLPTNDAQVQDGYFLSDLNLNFNKKGAFSGGGFAPNTWTIGTIVSMLLKNSKNGGFWSAYTGIQYFNDGGDPEFWKNFSEGKIDFGKNLDESARHIIRAIRYSIMNGGLGLVNIDAIFKNFDPNLCVTGSTQGFDKLFNMTIEEKNFLLYLSFGTPVSATKLTYNPVIDFDYATSNQVPVKAPNGQYQHILYLGGGMGNNGPFITVYSKNGSWDNHTYVYNWLFKH